MQCIDNVCKNPCEDINCVQNAECKVANHQAQCTCLLGFNGDPERFCQQSKISDCYKDDDCLGILACINGKCEEACDTLQPCGKNANCQVIDKGSVVILACSCPEGYDGDALSTCRPSKL